jgi:hypothetical protein
VVKRSCKNEPIWVAIHKCMEAIPGISLYSYLYPKLAKMLSFLLSVMFSLQQNQRTRGQNRFCSKGEKVAQTTYIHVSKCKTNKIKGERKKKYQARSIKQSIHSDLANSENHEVK